jgi:hypothetical protein
MGRATPRGGALRFFDDMIGQELDPSACVFWPYARNAAGYGVFSKKRGAVGSSIVARVACGAVHGLPPTPRHEAAHSCGNGDKGCVNPAHVAWKTSAENKADQLLHGTRNYGERNGGAKLCADQVHQIREMAQYTKQSVIARQMGVDPATVSNIVRGQRWAHI